MKLSWRDVLAALFAAFGAVVVYAKLNAYSWWLLGSWKGALGVVAVIGLAIMVTYFVDWYKNEGSGIIGEALLWLVAGSFVVGSLLVETSKAAFIWTTAVIGLAWLAQLAAHSWDSVHKQTPRLMHGA